jgi:hypothetical protein
VEKLQAYAGTAGALAEEADGAVAPLIDATARLHIAVDTANVRIGALADFTEQSKVMSLDVTAREWDGWMDVRARGCKRWCGMDSCTQTPVLLFPLVSSHKYTTIFVPISQPTPSTPFLQPLVVNLFFLLLLKATMLLQVLPLQLQLVMKMLTLLPPPPLPLVVLNLLLLLLLLHKSLKTLW